MECSFKSRQNDRIYEPNTHEGHHQAVITSGKLRIVFEPQVSELELWQSAKK